MELPLYYDLDEFEDYYEDYLKAFENDTLTQVVKTDRLIDHYSYFVSEKGDVINFKNEYEVYADGKIETVQLKDIVFIITDFVDKYLEEIIENFDSFKDDSVKEFIIHSTKNYEVVLEYFTRLIARGVKFGKFYDLDLRLVDFIITHLRCFFRTYHLNKFSENSKIEIIKIYRFLKNKQVENSFLMSQIIQPQSAEFPENNYSETKKVEISDIDTDLLKYLSENFTSTDKRFSDLTRYNQIYRFLNEGRDYNLEHRAYKKLIKDLFGFDYLNREISKVQTPKHLTQLETLALNYHNSQK